MDNYISLEDVTFSYAEFSLSSLHLQIKRNTKIAIIGPSGCGKTTLISLIAGIHIPQKGKIRIGETNIYLLKEKGRRDFRLKNIGFIFQNFELLEYLSAYDNIILPLKIQKSKISKEVNERIYSLSETVGIHKKLHRMPGQLSQGEKQRVAIVRSLLHQPDLIIADEPTGNLDPKNSEKIMDLLIKETPHQTLIVTTHDHAFLDRFDKVWNFTKDHKLQEWQIS